MQALLRQEIAEIFLVLIILTMINKINVSAQRMLMIVFGTGLITSHYGLSYLFMFFAPAGYIFMNYILKHKSNSLNTRFLLFYIVLTFFWYMNMSNGSVFSSIIKIGQQIYGSLHSDFLSTTTTSIATGISPNVTDQILKTMYLISQVLIFIGIINVLLNLKKFKFYYEYLAVSIIFILVLIASVLTSSTGMNFQRLFQITSIFLSPFFVIGGVTVLNIIYRSINVSFVDKSITLRILSIFLVIFLMFNNGFVQEITHESPRSIALNQELFKNYNLEYIKGFYSTITVETDVFGVEWLSKNRYNETKIFTDKIHNSLIFTSYGMMPEESMLYNLSDVNYVRYVKIGYIYLGYFNTRYGLMTGPNIGQYWNIEDISPLLDEKSLIYSNGGSKIFK
jgi:uncharacterized membrane protein